MNTTAAGRPRHRVVTVMDRPVIGRASVPKNVVCPDVDRYVVGEPLNVGRQPTTTTARQGPPDKAPHRGWLPTHDPAHIGLGCNPISAAMARRQRAPEQIRYSAPTSFVKYD